MSVHQVSISDARRALRDTRPRTPDQLHGYCRAVLGFDIPRQARLSRSHAPFDYLCHAFFEESPVRDCAVWANRGGGKTQMGALATLLDLVFKPGIQIRILGGSLDQSAKMYGYLREMLECDDFIDLVDGRITGRRIGLTNGSTVEVLAQSEQSVRGQRVQKLRCDEVELFTPEVWQAAQFVTRTAMCGEILVPGCIEVLSTMHRPFGLMRQLTQEPEHRRVFRWSALEVMERCPPQRVCEECSLWSDCGGLARETRGFFRIEDAIQQKRRSSPEAWRAEMLCQRPSRSDCVYAEFDESVHIKRFELPEEVDRSSLLWVGGMDFGFRSPTVMLWACFNPDDDVLHIVDEHIAAGLTVEEHIRVIRNRDWPAPAWLGIDPAGYQRHEHSGKSTATLLKNEGFVVRARRMQVHAGLEAVRARLRTADDRIRLQIDPRCEGLIRALHSYHFPPERPEATDPVKDGSDHACDALRYLIINLDRDGMAMRFSRYA